MLTSSKNTKKIKQKMKTSSRVQPGQTDPAPPPAAVGKRLLASFLAFIELAAVALIVILPCERAVPCMMETVLAPQPRTIVDQLAVSMLRLLLSVVQVCEGKWVTAVLVLNIMLCLYSSTKCAFAVHAMTNNSGSAIPTAACATSVVLGLFGVYLSLTIRRRIQASIASSGRIRNTAASSNGSSVYRSDTEKNSSKGMTGGEGDDVDDGPSTFVNMSGSIEEGTHAHYVEEEDETGNDGTDGTNGKNDKNGKKKEQPFADAADVSCQSREAPYYHGEREPVHCCQFPNDGSGVFWRSHQHHCKFR